MLSCMKLIGHSLPCLSQFNKGKKTHAASAMGTNDQGKPGMPDVFVMFDFDDL